MRSWFSHFSDHWDHLQDLLQRRRLGPRAFDLLVLEKDLRITCISNKVPGGAGAAGLGVMLGEPLQWNINSPSRFSSGSSRAPRPSHASAHIPVFYCRERCRGRSTSCCSCCCSWGAPGQASRTSSTRPSPSSAASTPPCLRLRRARGKIRPC